MGIWTQYRVLRRKGITALLVIPLVLATGCIKREIERRPEPPVSEGSVRIVFDWAPLAGKGVTPPEAMQLYFYSENGKVIHRPVAAAGDKIALEPGMYQVLAFNEDAEGVSFSGLERYIGAKAYAAEQETRAVVLSQPRNLYGVSLGMLTVPAGETIEQRLIPDDYVSKINVVVSVTGAFDAVTSCTASLTGIARAVNLSTREPVTGEAGTVLAEQKKTNSGFESVVSVFGIVTDETGNPVENMLGLDIRLKNGGTQHIDLDITDGLEHINDIVTTQVKIDLDVEVSEQIDGGFTAGVVGWSSEQGEIVIRPDGAGKAKTVRK